MMNKIDLSIEVKFFHLLAWDEMMRSHPYWMRMMQEKAEKENAPKDAIWCDSKGKWHRASELEGRLKDQIEARAEQIKEKYLAVA